MYVWRNMQMAPNSGIYAFVPFFEQKNIGSFDGISLLSSAKHDTMCAFSTTGEVKMAQTAFSIRMDEDLKRDFGEFCNEVGMSMSTAFVVFAKATLRERQIPFVIGERKAVRYLRQERLDPAALRAKEAFEAHLSN